MASLDWGGHQQQRWSQSGQEGKAQITLWLKAAHEPNSQYLSFQDSTLPYPEGIVLLVYKT